MVFGKGWCLATDGVRSSEELFVFLSITNAQCPMPNAQLPITNYQLPITD
ncbi:MAG: hypothetical protein AAF630_12190 [Cyanobacteria bacterium P01_C01_bin.38]